MDSQSVSPSVMPERHAKTAKWIEVLFGVETLEDRMNIVLRYSVAIPVRLYGVRQIVHVAKPTQICLSDLFARMAASHRMRPPPNYFDHCFLRYMIKFDLCC